MWRSSRSPSRGPVSVDRDGPAIVDHVVHRGELASDAAVDEGRVEVVLADPATGERESYGRIVRRRRCGKYRLRLARDLGLDLWWIVAIDERPDGSGYPIVLGFSADHGEACARCFDAMTEADLDRAIARSEDSRSEGAPG